MFAHYGLVTTEVIDVDANDNETGSHIELHEICYVSHGAHGLSLATIHEPDGYGNFTHVQVMVATHAITNLN